MSFETRYLKKRFTLFTFNKVLIKNTCMFYLAKKKPWFEVFPMKWSMYVQSTWFDETLSFYCVLKNLKRSQKSTNEIGQLDH